MGPDEFLLAAVHDVRALLRRSNIQTERVRRAEGLPDGLAIQLEEVLGAGREMDTLLHRLVKYALAGTQQFSGPFATLSMSYQVAVRRLGDISDEVQIRPETEALPKVDAPPGLSGVFGELFDNAVKFRKGPVKITLLIEDGEHEHVFGLRDTGIGFEQRFAEKIMLPFERLHPASTYAGTGLGLAICRRAIGAWGGRLWAESRLGTGSTFWFTLPHAWQSRGETV